MGNKLTNAQIYTLRGMYSGIHHLMLYNGKRGNERRPLGRYTYEDVCNRSLPKLMREGYVEFKDKSIDKEKGKWYTVTLTSKGREAVKTQEISL